MIETIHFTYEHLDLFEFHDLCVAQHMLGLLIDRYQSDATSNEIVFGWTQGPIYDDDGNITYGVVLCLEQRYTSESLDRIAADNR